MLAFLRVDWNASGRVGKIWVEEESFLVIRGQGRIEEMILVKRKKIVLVSEPKELARW